MSGDAFEQLRQGQPEAALASLQAAVRAEPAAAKHRVFLFQLLCVLGQWDRALTQLNVAGDLDAGTLGMVQVYREALGSETLRAEVFAGRRSPLIFGEPEQWIAMLLEALRLTAAGEHEHAAALRAQAFEQAPATSGVIDGRPFAWLADADPRIGPMLEAVVNGRYYWIPFNRIAELRLEEPTDLRDLVWLPAEIRWANGGEAVALIPARYPWAGALEPQLLLARKTEWAELADGVFAGLGQRMLATDGDEHALLSTRHIALGDAAVTRSVGVAAS